MSNSDAEFWKAKYDRQCAEIGRLQHDLTRSMDATTEYLNEVERLTSERDRLRVMLETMASDFGAVASKYAAALAEPGEKG